MINDDDDSKIACLQNKNGRESQTSGMKKMQCNRRISRETNDRDASLGLAFREIGSAFLIPGDDPSGDGKGTNNNIANVKTGFGIIHQNAKKYPG